MVRVLSITFTGMFEPRHNILSNVRGDIRKYVVSWLKHSHESNRPVPGPIVMPVCYERQWINVFQPMGRFPMDIQRFSAGRENIILKSFWAVNMKSLKNHCNRISVAGHV